VGIQALACLGTPMALILRFDSYAIKEKALVWDQHEMS
jgi:hypothetical protein